MLLLSHRPALPANPSDETCRAGRRPAMPRTLLNLLVDLGVALILFGMLLTGYVIKFPLPPGTNKEWMLWGMTRHQWGEIHFWISTVLLVLIVVHVCLHWTWIVTVVRQRLGLPKTTQNATLPDGWVAVLMLVVAFGGFATLAHLGIERVPESHSEICRDDAVEVAKQKKPGPLTEPPANHDPNLTWKDVYPIFEKACLSCHGPQKQRGDFRVDQPGELFSSVGKTAWIIPGKGEESPLIEIVSGRRQIALPNQHRLADADVARLRKWVNSGAAH
jgi:hypothetical protein